MSVKDKRHIPHSSKNDDHCKTVANRATHFVLKLKQENGEDKYDDLIESSAESLTPIHRKQWDSRREGAAITEAERCIGPVCTNYSYPSLNGLCKDCYDFLLEKKLRGLRKETAATMKPDLLQLSDTGEFCSITSIGGDSSQISSAATTDIFFNSDRNHKLVHQTLPTNIGKLRLDDVAYDHHLTLHKENSFNPTHIQNRQRTGENSVSLLPDEQDRHWNKGSVDTVDKGKKSLDFHLTSLDLNEQNTNNSTLPLDNTLKAEYQITSPPVLSNRQKSFLDCSGFDEVADTIYNNCIVKARKCKREECTNFGNSKCRWYCNSCYRREQ